MNNFQTILLATFMALFVVGTLIFADVIKIGNKDKTSDETTNIVVWGTLDSSNIDKVFNKIESDKNNKFTVRYVKKSEESYEQSLIEAFSQNKGPDMFLLTPNMVLKFQKYIYKTPYDSFSEKDFRDTYIDGADIFLRQDGILAFPLVVDPMVMYYNKNIFANEGFANVPKYWDELNNLNKILTKKENDGTVLQSMIALGQYDNINHAKEILSTLLLQNNIPIVQKISDVKYESKLILPSNSSSDEPVSITMFNFFTSFSNPTGDSYSWNRSLPSSLNMFTSGKLALYLGYASELFNIESMNPNLSFDVTSIMQKSDKDNKVTYGNIYALAINKNSKNLSKAPTIAGTISQDNIVSNLSVALSLPPASRSLLSKKPGDNSYLYSFFNSAIVTRSWLDPDRVSTDGYFKESIENIISNKFSVQDAISRLGNQLQLKVNSSL